MALTYSVHVSGGRTDYFHGFEYFGLITLVTRVYRVLLLRFFLCACGVSEACLSSVSLCGGNLVLPMSTHHMPELVVQGGGHRFFCANYGFVSVAWRYGPALVDWPHGLPLVRYPSGVLCVSSLIAVCCSCSVCAGCACGG